VPDGSRGLVRVPPSGIVDNASCLRCGARATTSQVLLVDGSYQHPWVLGVMALLCAPITIALPITVPMLAFMRRVSRDRARVRVKLCVQCDGFLAIHVRYQMNDVTGQLTEPKTKRAVRTLRASPAVVDALKKRKTEQPAEKLKAGEACGNELGLIFTAEHGRSIDGGTLSRSCTRRCARTRACVTCASTTSATARRR
jgi:hypothetical protein